MPDTAVDTNQLIEQLLAEPDAERRRAHVNRVLTGLITSGTLARWADALSYKNGTRDEHARLDVQQVIAEHLTILLTGENPLPRGARSPLGALYAFVQRRVENYFTSGEVTGMAGASGLARRKRIIHRTTTDLTATLGREPSVSEVIAAANSWAAKHRPHAQKEGILLSAQDFTDSARAPLALMEALDAPVPAASDDRLEAQLVLRRLGRTAEQLYKPADAADATALAAYSDLRQILVAWASLVADGERPALKTLGGMTGLAPAAVRAAMSRLHHVLEAVRDTFPDREAA